MKAVVQRVINASVSVNNAVKGSIGQGLLVYLGVGRDDNTTDADWLAEKIIHLRIFDDSQGTMNLSLMDLVNPKNEPVNEKINMVNHHDKKVNHLSIGVLIISQFTLLGDARKGRRPSWDKAASPDIARELYQYFISKVSESVHCESGEFQAIMQVTYTNEGPVTILLDTKL